MWVHVEGDNTPNYNNNGYVQSPDASGTLLSDLKAFLDAAKAKNILVTYVLWNGALLRKQHSVNLFWDNAKLQAYIDKALTVPPIYFYCIFQLVKFNAESFNR